MRIALMRQGDSLRPVYGQDLEAIRKYSEGEILSVNLKRDRNIKHHKKFFAILRLVCENSEKWSSPEQLLIALRKYLGYGKIVPGIDGEPIFYPGSIRFEVMGQDEFERFYSLALPVLADEIGVTVRDLELNSLEYM